MRLNRVNSAIDRNERNKINVNFDILERDYGRAAMNAQYAVETSDEAKQKAESVQTQFNQVVIEGDSSVEAAQARVDLNGTIYTTLKERLDAENALVTQQLEQITYTNIMDFGAYKDGTHVEETTQALKDAASSGTTVKFPEGTYLVNDTIVLGAFTSFIGDVNAKIKVVSDVDVFYITKDNQVKNFEMDFTLLSQYTKDVFVASSETKKLVGSWAKQYMCVIDDITFSFPERNPDLDIKGTVFHFWSRDKDKNGVAYPGYAQGFYNLFVKNIYVRGAVKYILRGYTYNERYMTSYDDTPAWITGVHMENVSVFGDTEYVIFDSESDDTMLDERYRGVMTSWFSNIKFQYKAESSKRFAFISAGMKVFKNCMPWDFPIAPYALLYRTQATYLTELPYIHLDYDFGSMYDRFTEVKPNDVTINRKEFIRKKVTDYLDASKNAVDNKVNLKLIDFNRTNSDASPLYKIAEFIPDGTHATSYMLLNTGYLSGIGEDGLGLITISFTVIDEAPDDPNSVPKLTTIFNPDIRRNSIGTFGIKKEIRFGRGVISIYFKPYHTIGPAGTILTPKDNINNYQFVIKPEKLSTNATFDSIGATESLYKSSNMSSATAPTNGWYFYGDKVYNSSPAANAYLGWVCVTSGNPGVWKGFGQIQS